MKNFSHCERKLSLNCSLTNQRRFGSTLNSIKLGGGGEPVMLFMFIGLNPATANFGGFYDKLYYESLRKFRFQNAHLTDIFKTKETNSQIDKLLENKRLKDEAKGFLEIEINILKPKLIVLLGERVGKLFFEFFPKTKIHSEQIGHYSYRYKSRTELRKRWFKQMNQLTKSVFT